jgi:hypothetical protein
MQDKQRNVFQLEDLLNSREAKMTDYPYPKESGVRNIALDLILTIITCGIYGLYWQYKQMQTLNSWLKRKDFDFLLWLLLSIITCGIFAMYYEYKMAKGINEIQRENNFKVADDLALICLLLAIFQLIFVSLAIQQLEINKFYGATSDSE